MVDWGRFSSIKFVKASIFLHKANKMKVDFIFKSRCLPICCWCYWVDHGGDQSEGEKKTLVCPSWARSLWTVLRVSLSSSFAALSSGERDLVDSRYSLKNPARSGKRG